MENIKEKVENKIIDLIALESGGRLIAEKPERGVDLVIQKRGDYPAKQIFLNLEISDKPLDDKKTFSENNYLLLVSFDFVTQKIDEKFWLLPAFPEKIDKKIFINFLIQKLIVENK